MTTEIETVTVTFEELKADLDHYMELQQTKRVSVIRDGQEVAVLGPWLPDEERIMTSEWQRFFHDLFPPEPIDPDRPYLLTEALEATRGYRPFT